MNKNLENMNDDLFAKFEELEMDAQQSSQVMGGGSEVITAPTIGPITEARQDGGNSYIDVLGDCDSEVYINGELGQDPDGWIDTVVN